MSVLASGTQLAVINTEHVLETISTPGDYLFNVNTTPMLTGDELELRVKNRVVPAGATVGYLKGVFEGVQPADDVLKSSVPFRVEHEAKVTLKQTLGTGRSYEWSVWRIDS